MTTEITKKLDEFLTRYPKFQAQEQKRLAPFVRMQNALDKSNSILDNMTKLLKSR